MCPTRKYVWITIILPQVAMLQLHFVTTLMHPGLLICNFQCKHSYTCSDLLSGAILIGLYSVSDLVVDHVWNIRVPQPPHPQNEKGSVGSPDKGFAKTRVPWLWLCWCRHRWTQRELFNLGKLKHLWTILLIVLRWISHADVSWLNKTFMLVVKEVKQVSVPAAMDNCAGWI